MEAWRLFVKVTLKEYQDHLLYEMSIDPSTVEENSRILQNLNIQAMHVFETMVNVGWS